MSLLRRSRLGAIELPVVEVEFAIRVFRDPLVRATLTGGQRHVVDMALRVLNETTQEQIDGKIVLGECHIRVILLAIGMTMPWMRDLLFHRLDDDEPS